MTPTPVHRWHLPGVPEGCEVYVKRDDLTGAQLSGNKVRKLEFLLADALARDADCVVTIGAVQSNHARATAVAARYLGLDAHLVLRAPQSIVDAGDPGMDGNLMIERAAGARVHLVSKRDYAKIGGPRSARDCGDDSSARVENRTSSQSAEATRLARGDTFE